MNIRSISIIAALSAFAAAQASPNLITNGSFETNSFGPGSFYTISPTPVATSPLNGWAVIDTGDSGAYGTSSIDLINQYWQASDGSWSVDLAGNAGGKIAQDVSLTVGQWYHLSFDLAGNPDGSPTTKVAIVTAGGATVSKLFTLTGGNTKANMGWTSYSFDFLATGAPTTISFASGNGGSPFGPALDNVQLTTAPGPAALLSMGLGLAVNLRKRRRSA